MYILKNLIFVTLSQPLSDGEEELFERRASGSLTRNTLKRINTLGTRF